MYKILFNLVCVLLLAVSSYATVSVSYDFDDYAQTADWSIHDNYNGALQPIGMADSWKAAGGVGGSCDRTRTALLLSGQPPAGGIRGHPAAGRRSRRREPRGEAIGLGGAAQPGSQAGSDRFDLAAAIAMMECSASAAGPTVGCPLTVACPMV